MARTTVKVHESDEWESTHMPTMRAIPGEGIAVSGQLLINGTPGALRKLARALGEAADKAEQARQEEQP